MPTEGRKTGTPDDRIGSDGNKRWPSNSTGTTNKPSAEELDHVKTWALAVLVHTLGGRFVLSEYDLDVAEEFDMEIRRDGSTLVFTVTPSA